MLILMHIIMLYQVMNLHKRCLQAKVKSRNPRQNSHGHFIQLLYHQ